MTKVMCNCITCKHNPSNIYGTYGECTREEIKVIDEEFFGAETIDDEPEWFDRCICNDFSWEVGKVLVYENKTKKTGVKIFTTEGDDNA